mgnify:CR=1 FL=1
MYFSALITSVVMATVASAVACPHHLAHLADFRVFGSLTCHDKNLGIWTVVEGDVGVGECRVSMVMTSGPSQWSISTRVAPVSAPRIPSRYDDILMWQCTCLVMKNAPLGGEMR